MKKYILSILSLIMICSTFGCSQQPVDPGNENTELNNGSNEKTSLITVYDLGEDYWDEQIQEAKDYFENFIGGEIGYKEDPWNYDWVNEAGYITVDSVKDLTDGKKYLPGIASGYYFIEENKFSPSTVTSEFYKASLNESNLCFIWSTYSEIFNKTGSLTLENVSNDIYVKDKYLENYLETFITSTMKDNGLTSVPKNTVLMYEFLVSDDPDFEPASWNSELPYALTGEIELQKEATVGYWAVRGVKDLGNNTYEIDVVTTDKLLTLEARVAIYKDFLRQFENQSENSEQATILLNIGYDYESMKSGAAQYGYWMIDFQEYGFAPLVLMSPFTYNVSNELIDVGNDFMAYTVNSLEKGASISWNEFVSVESTKLKLEKEKIENLLFSYLIYRKTVIGG